MASRAEPPRSSARSSSSAWASLVSNSWSTTPKRKSCSWRCPTAPSTSIPSSPTRVLADRGEEIRLAEAPGPLDQRDAALARACGGQRLRGERPEVIGNDDPGSPARAISPLWTRAGSHREGAFHATRLSPVPEPRKLQANWARSVAFRRRRRSVRRASLRRDPRGSTGARAPPAARDRSPARGPRRRARPRSRRPSRP